MSTTTQRWLRQNVSSYTHKDRVLLDFDTALDRFTSLRPKSDVYTYDDGRTQLLLCLHGVLPISFRGASYNIPIAVWVTKEYPRQPPIVYVVPTQDMLVRPSKHVDVSGQCKIEYIQHWEKKSEACNLSALLEALQQEFSRGPPVYAKPKTITVPIPPSSPSPLQESSASSPSRVALGNDRPALPPKPNSSAHSLLSPKPAIVAAPIASPQYSSTANLLNRPPPALPSAQSPQITGPPTYSRPSYQHTLRNHNDGTVPVAGPALPPDHDNRWSVPLAGQAISGQLNQSRAPNTPSPPVPSQHLQGAPNLRQRPTANLLDDETADSSPSVLQVPTVAPPRPPNPELLRLHAQVHDKIASELASLSHVMLLDGERLRAQQTDLLTGEPAIRDEMARLEAVRDVCNNVSSRLRNTVDQGERNIAELRRKGDPEVDELICSTSIVHNQLINLVAEDNAIEDSIYHLHRALNTGRIDLERFLRSTRVLAEEQFTKRALIEKIQHGIPTASYS
ncbi:UEV-domain-containing protein [Suillus fuscotomentosus]|uniref:UEV-domain-containing protein n=1 Tax=Suillus fuscotomentosus TaxID=1912939 RepID=A0AAD4EGK7_9AGAM|nr:UEV-domain-containing protein [Suillus fuscotomentosus]KAG1905691.1 UEV-domain-containing protein [Suillus fuscotomentosus]